MRPRLLGVAELEKTPPPPAAGRSRRARLPGMAGGQPLHLPRLPRVQLQGEDERRAGHPRERPGPAARRGLPLFDGLRNLGRCPRTCATSCASRALLHDHQGEPPLDRPPAVPMDAIASSVRRRGQGRRRAPLRRPVHRRRLQRSPRHPAAAPEGGGRAGARRLPAGQPRRQGAAPHPGDLSPRRAVPDHRGRAVPDRHGHPAAAGAAAHRAVRAPRSVRALRLLPGLRAARPLRHRPAPRFQAILARGLHGARRPGHTQIGDAPLARLHFIVATSRGAIPDVDPEEVERQLLEAAAPGPTSCRRRWSRRTARRSGCAWSGAMARPSPPAIASASADAGGLRHRAFEEALHDRRPGRRPLPADEAQPRELRSSSTAPAASPALGHPAHAGEHGPQGDGGEPYDVQPAAASSRSGSATSALTPTDGRAVDLSAVRPRSRTRSARSGAARWRTTASTGSCCGAGLGWRAGHDPARLLQVSAPGRHPVQPGLHGRDAGENPRHRPAAGRALPRPLRSRRQERPEQRRAAIAAEIEAALDEVTNLDEDRILRRFLNPIQATLRTNFFQRRRDGQPKSYLSLKLDSPRRRGPAAAAAVLRDLRLQPAGGGDPPARRQGGARRHPLVRPARGLPHRGPGPDEGADGEERRHRAGRLQGRLRGQAAAGDRRREALMAEGSTATRR